MFVAKFVSVRTFVVPVLFSPLNQAIVLSVVWGLVLLVGLSFCIARAQAIGPWKVIGEHLLIALCVVAAAHLVCDWVKEMLTEK